MTFAASGAATSPIAQPAIAETVDGLPRVCGRLGYLGPESRWSAKELVGYAADRISLHPRLSLEAGARLELSRGSAQGAADSITWWALSRAPRRAGHSQKTRGWPSSAVTAGTVIVFRFSIWRWAIHEAGRIRLRWNDTDGDRVFQHGERGALIANVVRAVPVRN